MINFARRVIATSKQAVAAAVQLDLSDSVRLTKPRAQRPAGHCRYPTFVSAQASALDQVAVVAGLMLAFW